MRAQTVPAGRRRREKICRVCISSGPISYEQQSKNKQLIPNSIVQHWNFENLPPNKLAASKSAAGSAGLDSLLEPELPSLPFPFSLSIAPHSQCTATTENEGIGIVTHTGDFELRLANTAQCKATTPQHSMRMSDFETLHSLSEVNLHHYLIAFVSSHTAGEFRDEMR